MARVSITINANTYDIACADGEEQHILDLAGVLDRRVGELVAAIGQAGESRLLAMAGLLMADEMAELKEEVQRLRAEAEVTPPTVPAAPAVDQDRIASVMEALAGRIESIAQRVEQA
mgnify:CR=1 FL=1